jgi:hypothetical protein
MFPIGNILPLLMPRTAYCYRSVIFTVDSHL